MIESAAHRAATEAAALFELPGRSLVELAGKDRASFLHNFCTNEVVKTPAGAGREAFLTSGQAKLLAWLQILVADDKLIVGAEPELGPKIVPYLDRYLIAEDVQLADRSAEFTQLLLSGPRMEAVLTTAGVAAPAGEWRHHEAVLADAPVRLLRRDWLGLPGCFLFVPSAEASSVAASLHVAGAMPGDAAAYEMLRLEAGIPIYGLDLDETNLPQEANRTEQAISFTKGCYLGQETVARIRAYGHVNRLRVGLKLIADCGLRIADLPSLQSEIRNPQSAISVFQGAKEVGRLTSLSWSPTLGAPLGMGFVRRGCEAPGTKLDLELEGRKLTAEVTTWPRPG